MLHNHVLICQKNPFAILKSKLLLKNSNILNIDVQMSLYTFKVNKN